MVGEARGASKNGGGPIQSIVELQNVANERMCMYMKMCNFTFGVLLGWLLMLAEIGGIGRPLFVSETCKVLWWEAYAGSSE